LDLEKDYLYPLRDTQDALELNVAGLWAPLVFLGSQKSTSFWGISAGICPGDVLTLRTKLNGHLKDNSGTALIFTSMSVANLLVNETSVQSLRASSSGRNLQTTSVRDSWKDVLADPCVQTVERYTSWAPDSLEQYSQDGLSQLVQDRTFYTVVEQDNIDSSLQRVLKTADNPAKPGETVTLTVSLRANLGVTATLALIAGIQVSQQQVIATGAWQTAQVTLTVATLSELSAKLIAAEALDHTANGLLKDAKVAFKNVKCHSSRSGVFFQDTMEDPHLWTSSGAAYVTCDSRTQEGPVEASWKSSIPQGFFTGGLVLTTRDRVALLNIATVHLVVNPPVVHVGNQFALTPVFSDGVGVLEGWGPVKSGVPIVQTATVSRTFTLTVETLGRSTEMIQAAVTVWTELLLDGSWTLDGSQCLNGQRILV
jgi:hypothetical protein